MSPNAGPGAPDRRHRRGHAADVESGDSPRRLRARRWEALMTTTLAPTDVYHSARVWSSLTVVGTVAVVVAFLVAGQQLNVAATSVKTLRRTADTLTSQVA